ncbi:hypothetical protein C8R45DRAFT_314879 [Mycena sanguinolenta]|nr:hypothetical protein C8R45DRAFT_314879 [Mycena sanguinolenta]
MQFAGCRVTRCFTRFRLHLFLFLSVSHSRFRCCTFFFSHYNSNCQQIPAKPRIQLNFVRPPRDRERGRGGSMAWQQHVDPIEFQVALDYPLASTERHFYGRFY